MTTDAISTQRLIAEGIEAMHTAFGSLFFQLEPEASRDMRVFAVDAGEDEDPNLMMQAAVFDEEWRMVGEPITRMVAKVCLPDLGLK